MSVRELYGAGSYGECAEMLYKNTIQGKLVLWGMILLSYLLSGLSIYLCVNIISGNNHNSIIFAAAIGAITAIIVVAIAIGAAITVAAIAAIAAIGAIIVAVGAIAAAVTGAIAAITVGAAAAVIIDDSIGPNFYCWLTIKTLKPKEVKQKW